jgi:hypothetical protein
MSDATAPILELQHSGAVQQELAVVFALETAANTVQLEELLAIVTAWVAVGDRGGFVRHSAMPNDAAMVLDRFKFDDPQRPAFLIRTRQLDRTAWAPLRHATWRWSARGLRMQVIQVIDRTPGGPWATEQVPEMSYSAQPTEYPPLCDNLGFTVIYSNPGEYGKTRRCVIDFDRPVQATSIGAVIAAVSDWFELARYGAWAPPDFNSAEAMVDLANLAPYDEYSVELALSMFEASECAWYVLCNVLGRLSVDHEALSGVEID